MAIDKRFYLSMETTLQINAYEMEINYNDILGIPSNINNDDK